MFFANTVVMSLVIAAVMLVAGVALAVVSLRRLAGCKRAFDTRTWAGALVLSVLLSMGSIMISVQQLAGTWIWT